MTSTTATSTTAASATAASATSASATSAVSTVSTREVLMDTAEVLFAERGVQGATTREIVEAARQRNASAITYHFGSRENLLLEILARRGAPVDRARGEMLSALPAEASTVELVECLVDPYLAQLGSSGGRAYLRIVDQLRGRFAAWRVDSDAATTVNLARILDELEARAEGTPAERNTRLIGLIILLTSLAAERAEKIDSGVVPELGAKEFTRAVGAMCSALLEG